MRDLGLDLFLSGDCLYHLRGEAKFIRAKSVCFEIVAQAFCLKKIANGCEVCSRY